MDLQQKTYEIIKRNLELKDNWGNNPYMPKEKADALVKELQGLVANAYKMGKNAGQKEMLVGTSELFNQIVEAKKEELNLRSDEADSIQSYFKWHRTFFKDKQ
jgi:hypothetical protein